MRTSPLLRSLGAIAAAATLVAGGSALAGDAGVVRITDHGAESVVRISDRPVVRGQSPVNLTDEEVLPAAMFSLCPTALGSPDVCCDPGYAHICEGGACSSGSPCGSCPSYHGCPQCGPCGTGHQCPVIGWISHLLSSAHEAKCKLLTSLGIPCHCGQQTCQPRCRRHRIRSFICRSPECRQERRERFGIWLSRTRLNYFIPRGCCGKGCPPFGHYQIVYPVDPWYGDGRDAGIYAAEGIGGPVSVPLAPVIRHTYNYGWGVPSSRLTPISHLATGPVYGYGPWGYGAPGWGAPLPVQPVPAQSSPAASTPPSPPGDMAFRY